VLSGCDADANQINAVNSCFFDADMRDMEHPFADASVEVLAQRAGMGALPYVSWLSNPSESVLTNFSDTWWAAVNRGLPNRLHLLGIEDAAPEGPEVGGSPFLVSGQNLSGASFVYTRKIEQLYPGNPIVQRQLGQYCAVHELTHNFSVLGFTKHTYHCSQPAFSPPGDGHSCVMQSVFDVYVESPRFCTPHALLGGSALTDVQTSVRSQIDPLPF
jgi:hypothetical protein